MPATNAFCLAESPVMQVMESVAESLGVVTGVDEEKVAEELASLDALWEEIRTP